MYANRRNCRVLLEIGVEEHDGDVRFFTGCGNTAVSLMRNASGHNYWKSSFIMDVAMGQIYTTFHGTHFYSLLILPMPYVVASKV